jgi:uncharacterized protein (TIGR03067 family)
MEIHMRMIGTLVIVGCIAAMGCGKKDAAGEDTKFVQGNWGVESVDILNDRKPRPDEFEKTYFKITDTKGVVWDRGKEQLTFAIKLNSSIAVKEVDFTEADADGKTDGQMSYTKYDFSGKGPPVTSKAERPRNVIKAIYKIEGDKIILAIAGHPKSPRPTEFKAIAPAKKYAPGVPEEETVGVALVTLKKISDDEASKRSVPVAPPTFNYSKTTAPSKKE